MSRQQLHHSLKNESKMIACSLRATELMSQAWICNMHLPAAAVNNLFMGAWTGSRASSTPWADMQEYLQQLSSAKAFVQRCRPANSGTMPAKEGAIGRAFTGACMQDDSACRIVSAGTCREEDAKRQSAMTQQEKKSPVTPQAK